MLTVIINDAFCEAPHATIHSALKATISGTVTKVMGETKGWWVWDQAPSGVWEKGPPLPPPRARYSGQTCSQHITPMAACPKAKPVYTKTGKIVSYGLLVASQG